MVTQVDLGSAFGSTYLDKAFAEGGELEKSACSSAVSHVVWSDQRGWFEGWVVVGLWSDQRGWFEGWVMVGLRRLVQFA